MDRGLLGHDVVWIGAGSASHMASLPPPELQRLAGASIVDIATPS
jgi:prolyl-tRNA editing enzyme YbaK/EbsC (Cys-tRNA(Pro) deacylase)